MPALPRPRLGACGLALVIIALVAPYCGAQKGSGLVAAEAYESFPVSRAYIDAGTAAAHEDLRVDGRILLTAVDEAGHSLPFANYRIYAGGRLARAGRAFADGSFLVYPRDPPEVPLDSPWRVEVACRGAAAVDSFDPRGQDAGKVELGHSLPLPSPIACDLVFALDTTISMAAALPALKRAIVAARDEIEKLRPELALRTGLVLFRDHGDEYLTKSYPLDADSRSFDSALAGAVGLGGGDIPEDVGAGLRAAVSGMGWSEDGVRIVFVVTDAVPALRPGELAAGGSRYADACREALAKGIRICAIGVGKPALGGEYALRQIALWTGGTYVAADYPGGPAYGPLDGDERTRPSGIVRSSLEDIVARIALAEALAASAVRPGGGEARDPALALLEGVQSTMASGLRYPEAARLRGISGTAVVDLRVSADGQLLESRVGSTSGSAILDRAALDLARSAFPTANPAASAVELEISLEYRLESDSGASQR